MPILRLDRAVGRNCPNTAGDIRSLTVALMEIDKIPRSYRISEAYDDALDRALVSTQHHWMLNPDAVVTPGGLAQTYIQTWSVKKVDDGVELTRELRAAWDLVNPLLPQGSRCTSGYRSAEKQRQLLHNFFLKKYRSEILAKIGQTEYDSLSKNLLANEARVLDLVHGCKQAIAAPGKSKHQQGKAVDMTGPSITRIVETTKVVARANPQIFTGKVIKERNGCVHFEIR